MRTRSRLILAGLGLILVVCALLTPLPISWKAIWVDRLMDLGHVPLFALLTWCLACGSGGKWWPAVAAATVLAALGEFGQAWVRRSPDFRDFLWGALGCLLAVVCARAFARPLRLRRVLGHFPLAAALLAWPLTATLPTLIDAVVAYRAFPILCDFQTPWQQERWKTRHAALTRSPDPDQSARWVGQLEFLPAADESSSAVLLPIVRDWNGYQRLCLDFSVKGEPLTLLISLSDGHKIAPTHKRFERVQRFAPGKHRVILDLPELARGGEFSPLDLGRVRSFHLMAEELREPRRVIVYGIYLERD